MWLAFGQGLFLAFLTSPTWEATGVGLAYLSYSETYLEDNYQL